MPEILIAAVVVAFFAVFLFKLKKTPAGLGKGGEKKVSSILSRFGTVYDNYTYLDGKKHVKKVDHILVNCNGVFVVKSLKYAGEVSGKETDREWTQISTKKKLKHVFDNPFLAYKKSVEDVEKILGDLYRVNLYVVFVGCDVSGVRAKNAFQSKKLARHLAGLTPTLSNDEIKSILFLLDKSQKMKCSEEETIKKAHENKEKIEEGVCPKCNRILVDRKSECGAFKACPNQKRCRFKISVNPDDKARPYRHEHNKIDSSEQNLL